jgi:hypothetical protein
MMLKLLNRLILLSRPPVIALSLLLVALLAVNAYAQITVKGTVTDSENSISMVIIPLKFRMVKLFWYSAQ